FPRRWDYRAELAGARYILGRLAHAGGRLPEAEIALREAIADAQSGAAASHGACRQWLANASCKLGQVLRDASRSQEAEAAYRQALTLYEQFVADLPPATSLWIALYECYADLVHLLEQRGQADEAANLLRRAVDYYVRIVAALPEDGVLAP